MRRSAAYLALIAASVLWSASASGQSATTPPNKASSSDAEKNAFQTPTVGKDRRQNSSGSTSGTASGAGKSDSNPEARLNDHGPKNVQPDTAKPDGAKK